MAKPRILVLRGGAIGDFIFTLPAIQALRVRWPESYIELIGYPHIAHLAKAGGLANMIESLDKAEIAQFFSLKPFFPPGQADYIKSFDLIISYLFDPAGSVKRNLQLAGAKQVIYGCPIIDKQHAVDTLMKPLEELAIYPEGKETPRLNLAEPHRKAGKNFVSKWGGNVFVIHPGSGSKEKNWPLKHFISLADLILNRTGKQPFFLLGEADTNIAEQLAAAKSPVPVLSGLSLLDLAGILSACDAFIGNDSGTTHLAAALGIPVVAIYGPTDPAKWAPRGTNARIVSTLTAGKNDFSEITPEEVFSQIPA